MKKGFTLIELLAVIVILAVIALIATPIIINIINDSQKSAATNSAQLYVDGLSKKIMSENMNGEFNPSSCTISNGNISCDGQSLDYTVDGEKPTSGIITFTNGTITGYTLNIGEYNVVKSGNNITTTKGNVEVHSTYLPSQLLQYDPVNNTACTTGSTCYKWRVITVGDTTSNSTITLQMDHNIRLQMDNNIINYFTWVSKADYNDDENWNYGNNNKGPITVLKALETATASWDDSLKLNYTYDTSLGGTNTGYNYGTLSCTNGACNIAGNQITSNLKARMITAEEISALTVAAGAQNTTYAYNWTITNGRYYYFSNSTKVLGTTTAVASGETGSTTLSWLIENTHVYPDSGATSNAYGDINNGYWTLSPDSPDQQKVWSVQYFGWFLNAAITSSGTGIRPVITIPKSIFE